MHQEQRESRTFEPRRDWQEAWPRVNRLFGLRRETKAAWIALCEACPEGADRFWIHARSLRQALGITRTRSLYRRLSRLRQVGLIRAKGRGSRFWVRLLDARAVDPPARRERRRPGPRRPSEAPPLPVEARTLRLFEPEELPLLDACEARAPVLPEEEHVIKRQALDASEAKSVNRLTLFEDEKRQASSVKRQSIDAFEGWAGPETPGMGMDNGEGDPSSSLRSKKITTTTTTKTKTSSLLDPAAQDPWPRAYELAKAAHDVVAPRDAHRVIRWKHRVLFMRAGFLAATRFDGEWIAAAARTAAETPAADVKKDRSALFWGILASSAGMPREEFRLLFNAVRVPDYWLRPPRNRSP